MLAESYLIFIFARSLQIIILVVNDTYDKLCPCHYASLFGISYELHLAADQKKEKIVNLTKEICIIGNVH